MEHGAEGTSRTRLRIRSRDQVGNPPEGIGPRIMKAVAEEPRFNCID